MQCETIHCEILIKNTTTIDLLSEKAQKAHFKEPKNINSFIYFIVVNFSPSKLLKKRDSHIISKILCSNILLTVR